MAKSILDRQIHVYQCISDPKRKHIAEINGIRMTFRGDTAFAARKAAHDWRREAVQQDKLLSASQKAALLGTSTKAEGAS